MTRFKIDSSAILLPLVVNIVNRVQELVVPFGDTANVALEALSIVADFADNPVQQNLITQKYQFITRNFMKSYYVF